MQAVLIGVSDRTALWRHGKLKEEEYGKFIHAYARFTADHFDNIIVTPDDGVYTDIALEFGRLKNVKPIAYYPDRDAFYGIRHIEPNFPSYEIRPIGGDWYTLNADLTKQALVVICLGFSPGVLIELAFIKYHQTYGGRKDPRLKSIHCFIDERCIKERLPGTFHEQIQNLYYYSSLEELDRLLQKSLPNLR